MVIIVDIFFCISFLPEAGFGHRLLSLPASVCPYVHMSVNAELARARTHHPFKFGSRVSKKTLLRSLLFCGAIDFDLQGQIYLKSPNLPNFELVRTITHQLFKLGSPHLDQRCEILVHWLRCPLFCGRFTLTFKVKFNVESHNFRFHHYRKYITTREPWVPRLLYGPDFFMVSILCTYLDSFTVPTALCTYTALGSWGYFGV